MTNKGEPLHTLRMDAERWATLTAIAATVVRDNELPRGLGPADSRTGVMLRQLADGRLKIVRVEDS